MLLVYFHFYSRSACTRLGFPIHFSNEPSTCDHGKCKQLWPCSPSSSSLACRAGSAASLRWDCRSTISRMPRRRRSFWDGRSMVWRESLPPRRSEDGGSALLSLSLCGAAALRGRRSRSFSDMPLSSLCFAGSRSLCLLLLMRSFGVGGTQCISQDGKNNAVFTTELNSIIFELSQSGMFLGFKIDDAGLGSKN